MGTITHWLRALWHLLGSTRLATVLIAALLIASLLGSLFPQMPAELTAQDIQAAWLAAASLRYRQATGLLRAIGLFDVYHAPWFLALAAALLLNTLVCTAQRLPRLWRTFAERQRWPQVGSLLSHTAALLLLTAVIVRPAMSWQKRGVTLAPGQVYPVPHRLDLAMQAGPPVVERYPNGEPRNYLVPLTLLANATPVKTQTVRLNHPLTFHGLVFHLQSYNPAEQTTIWQISHDPTFGPAIGLAAFFLAGVIVSQWVPQPRPRPQAESQQAATATQACVPGGEADG